RRTFTTNVCLTKYELKELMSVHNPAAAHEEVSTLYNTENRGSKCRFCSGCCTPVSAEFAANSEASSSNNQ
uniref:Uncharacterized protein n=1 Tax=Pundamilia nyererei TaxID=303518 RepID=A0A3B4H9V9_9CICH